MSRIDEINLRLHQLLPTTRYEITDYKSETFKWASNYQSDIQYLLSKLDIAEKALLNLDRVLDFNYEQETWVDEERLKSSTTGTEMTIWHNQIEKVKILNVAKRNAKEALQQLRS